MNRDPSLDALRAMIRGARLPPWPETKGMPTAWPPPSMEEAERAQEATAAAGLRFLAEMTREVPW